jgi:hypothetical protein
MPSPQEVRPGAKVPRSGIYQDNLSQRRATLVKGEPAPPRHTRRAAGSKWWIPPPPPLIVPGRGPCSVE